MTDPKTPTDTKKPAHPIDEKKEPLLAFLATNETVKDLKILPEGFLERAQSINPERKDVALIRKNDKGKSTFVDFIPGDQVRKAYALQGLIYIAEQEAKRQILIMSPEMRKTMKAELAAYPFQVMDKEGKNKIETRAPKDMEEGVLQVILDVDGYDYYMIMLKRLEEQKKKEAEKKSPPIGGGAEAKPKDGKQNKPDGDVGMNQNPLGGDMILALAQLDDLRTMGDELASNTGLRINAQSTSYAIPNLGKKFQLG